VWSEKATTLRDHAYDMLQTYTEYMDGYLFHMALAEVWKFINQVNAYFHEHEPWKLAKQDKHAFEEVIAATCHSLYMIAYVLWPIMPEKMKQLGMSLGVAIEPHKGKNILEHFASDPWDRSFTLLVLPPLFIRPEPMKHEKEKKDAIVATRSESKENETITIDDVVKVQLVVGTIEQCEVVPKSDKLYKMHVNFGPLGMRQILAGVRQHFGQDELIGKQAVFVFNLQPRKLLGLESQGMMLVAPNAEGKSQRVAPISNVLNGTILR
jgi:methionyl-tRNA synthetase